MRDVDGVDVTFMKFCVHNMKLVQQDMCVIVQIHSWFTT